MVPELPNTYREHRDYDSPGALGDGLAEIAGGLVRIAHRAFLTSVSGAPTEDTVVPIEDRPMSVTSSMPSVYVPCFPTGSNGAKPDAVV